MSERLAENREKDEIEHFLPGGLRKSLVWPQITEIALELRDLVHQTTYRPNNVVDCVAEWYKFRFAGSRYKISCLFVMTVDQMLKVLCNLRDMRKKRKRGI